LVVCLKTFFIEKSLGEEMDSTEQILEQIAEQSKKPNNEIKKLIEDKKQKFSGLLTDSGAAFMVAKDLGVDVAGQTMQKMSVGQLKDGMQNVDLLVRAMQVFSPKQFEKNGKRGKLCNLVVADSSGEIRLTVWHDDVDKIQQQNVQRGSILLLHNCYVKSFNDKPQISLAYNGSMKVNPKNAIVPDLPEAKSQLLKVSMLQEGMNDVNLVGRVLRKFPVTEFEKEQRKGRVMNLLVGDETGIVKATAWNDLVDQAKNLEENDLIRIEGSYTKKGLNGMELHLGWQARIEQNPAVKGDVPEANEMLKAGAEKKKILQLAVGNNNVLVEGKIVAVNQGGLFYSVCPTCGGKVQRLDEGILCERCGEVKEPDIRPVVSFRVDDGSAQINAVAYGKEAGKIIGLDNEELKKQAAERGREALIEELQEMAGKQVLIVGRVKENSFSKEIEIAASVIEID